MLYLDGVYAEDAYGKIRFHRIKAPTVEELGVLVNRISRRVVKFLERRGFLERDDQSRYLTLETSQDEAMHQLYGHSITYRIAIGPQQGAVRCLRCKAYRRQRSRRRIRAGWPR